MQLVSVRLRGAPSDPAAIRAEAIGQARAGVDLCRLAGQPQMASRFLDEDASLAPWSPRPYQSWRRRPQFSAGDGILRVRTRAMAALDRGQAAPRGKKGMGKRGGDSAVFLTPSRAPLRPSLRRISATTVSRVNRAPMRIGGATGISPFVHIRRFAPAGRCRTLPAGRPSGPASLRRTGGTNGVRFQPARPGRRRACARPGQPGPVPDEPRRHTGPGLTAKRCTGAPRQRGMIPSTLASLQPTAALPRPVAVRRR